MAKVFLNLILFCSFSGFAQFGIGHIDTTFTDPDRNNRAVPVAIYYPADTSGDGVPLTATQGAFPVLSFGHGFVMGWEAYENLWTAIVPRGYLMVFPKTEGGIAPSHATFAADLAFVIKRCNELNNDNTSVFYGRVGASSAVMGHSMGGGAALLAAQGNNEITALAVLAAAQTNPSAIAAAANIQLPALLFAGANDCVTPPATNQLAMYEALTGSCKTYISITGGSHCQMAENNFLCSVGEATCSPSAQISRDAQHAVIDNYLVKWLDATLKDDCVAGTAFDSQILTDNAITFQKTCVQCAPLSVVKTAATSVEVGPNPFADSLTLTGAPTQKLRLVLTDAMGKTVIDQTIRGGGPIPAGHLKPGVYFYTLDGQGTVIGKGKLIKQ